MTDQHTTQTDQPDRELLVATNALRQLASATPHHLAGDDPDATNGILLEMVADRVEKAVYAQLKASQAEIQRLHGLIDASKGPSTQIPECA